MRRSNYGPSPRSLAAPAPGTVARSRRWNLVLIAILAFLVLGVFVVAETPRTGRSASNSANASVKEGLEGHISYSFNDSFWASLDTRYSFRGTTFVDGVTQNNAQQNFILGGEMNISFNPRNSLIFEFAKALVHNNGPALVGFSVKYDYTWARSTGKSR